MENKRIITEYLDKLGLYPIANAENDEDGVIIEKDATLNLVTQGL